MKNIAILASGSGTNAENIFNFFANGSRVCVRLVIYDRRDAGVAKRMEKYGVPVIYIPGPTWRDNPDAILNLLSENGIDLVVLAGFLRVIPPEITRAYAGRMLNIHPSLLPLHGGMGMFGHKVHEAVIDAGEDKSGVTVHYVSDDVDGGEILMQEVVEVSPDDTPETLERKIHPVEYALYPRAIVAAIKRLEEMPAIPPVPEAPADNAEPPAQADFQTPEAVTPLSPEEEWANTLGVKYDPAKLPPSCLLYTSPSPRDS